MAWVFLTRNQIPCHKFKLANLGRNFVSSLAKKNAAKPPKSFPFYFSHPFMGYRPGQ
jgi:hypothetical protein